MLSILGLFVFELKSAPYQSLQRSDSSRWVSKSRIGIRPAYQTLGQGEDTLNLSGTLYPEITGGKTSLEVLRKMKSSGKHWTFMLGSGEIFGQYVINSLDETHSLFFQNGQARKIDFTLKLTRVDDDRIDRLGNLGDDLSSLFENTIA